MNSKDRATELVKKFGQETALEVANMIFKEHYEYADPNYAWKGNNREICTNKEMCDYWNEVRLLIEKSTWRR